MRLQCIGYSKAERHVINACSAEVFRLAVAWRVADSLYYVWPEQICLEERGPIYRSMSAPLHENDLGEVWPCP